MEKTLGAVSLESRAVGWRYIWKQPAAGEHSRLRVWAQPPRGPSIQRPGEKDVAAEGPEKGWSLQQGGARPVLAFALHASASMPPFICLSWYAHSISFVLCFLAFYFYELKVGSSPVTSKSISTVFPTAFPHFVPVSHFGPSLHIPSFVLIIVCVAVICDPWLQLAESASDG